MPNMWRAANIFATVFPQINEFLQYIFFKYEKENDILIMNCIILKSQTRPLGFNIVTPVIDNWTEYSYQNRQIQFQCKQ